MIIDIRVTLEHNDQNQFSIPTESQIALCGDGSIDHFVNAFKAILYVMSFHPEVVNTLFDEEEY